MKNIALVGFMGTGKTVVGRRVAARLGMAFVDTDDLIEKRAGQKIADIFTQHGEARFRQLEREVVLEVAARQGHVIATGGGVVLNPDNLRDFERTGVIVCLWAEPAVIYERTKHMRHRPLMETGNRRQRIESLLRDREPLYKAIPHRVDSSSTTTVEQDVDAVIRIYQQVAGDKI